MELAVFQAKYGLNLDEEQQKAVQAIDGPVLLLAVPGSGKTTVLVSRLGFLLENGVEPEQILTMTYTVSATADMRGRFASVFGAQNAERMEFRTINGVSARIIRDYETLYGAHAFRLLTDEGQTNAVVSEQYRMVLREFPTESDIKAMRTAITYAKNRMLKLDEIEEMDQDLEGFSSVYRAYQGYLKEHRLMDYDDQMVYALAILRRCPELLRSWQNRYPWICVDEAQDTSKIQHRIISLLAGGAGNLFLVGDEDQSIYGFRAAYPKALTSFELDYPGARVLFLERNYRSTPQIVEKAGAFIRHNTMRREKRMRAMRPDGAAVRRIETKSRCAQYSYLLKVAENCDRETAILYRDNDCAIPLIDLLERSGLPYRAKQPDSTFFTCRVVWDVDMILRFAQDQTDGPRFLEIYYKLNLYLSRQEAQAAVKNCPEDRSILEFLAYSPAVTPFKKGQCRAMMTHMEHMLAENASKALYRLKTYMGFGEYLEKRGTGTQKLDILQALGQNEESLNSLMNRLETLRTLIKSNSAAPEANFILSTIHSSKGLEYDRVYLMDAIDGILPSQGADQDPERLEEERRLFYVAMTRAKNELNIFAPKGVGITTSFSDLVFPKSSHAPFIHPGWNLRPPSDESAAILKDLIPGTVVLHHAFGRGVILSRENDRARIRFEDGREALVLLSVCLRQGFLKIDQ